MFCMLETEAYLDQVLCRRLPNVPPAKIRAPPFPAVTSAVTLLLQSG